MSLTRRGYLTLWALAMLCVAGARADQGDAMVEIGDSRDRVIELLGAPQGDLRTGRREFLQYKNGEIMLEQGRVTKVTMLSQAEVRKRAAEAEARSRAAAASRAAHLAAGQAEKAAKLADESFTSLPPQQQATFWRDFQKRYPEVSVRAELADLGAAREAVQAERLQAIDARLAELNREIDAATAAGMAKSTINQSRKQRDARVRKTTLKEEQARLIAERARLTGP